MGPALLISPLLSLMRNQLDAAARMGVRAATINSDNQADWNAVAASLQADAIDILVISPGVGGLGRRWLGWPRAFWQVWRWAVR
jgi:superfamily II DNA helicase RecQ